MKKNKLTEKLVKDIKKNWSNWHWLLLASLLVGTYLRFFHLEQSLIFHGELGHNYLAIKNAVLDRKIPLLGPPTSHPWLYFGPLFYWLGIPVLYFSGFNPLSMAFFMALIGSLAIIINYEYITLLFNQRIAIISSFFIAVSPAWLILTRQSRFFSLTVILFYPFLYLLTKIVSEKSFSGKTKGKLNRRMFWLGLVLAVMINFHLTAITLIPAAIAAIFIARTKINLHNAFAASLGFLLPNLPLLIEDAKTGFSMLSKLIVWFPYRILGFVGIYPKNTATPLILQKNFLSLSNYFSGSFLTTTNKLLPILFSLLLVGWIVYRSKKIIKGPKKYWGFFSAVIILATVIISLFIHGDPPSHYFTIILPLPAIFIAVLIDDLLKLKKQRLFPAVIILIFCIYTGYFLKTNWFSFPKEKSENSEHVPYSLQLEIAKFIIKDIGDHQFSLNRVGPHDEFEGDYAQNYRYLLWWLGNEPVDKSQTTYTIFEDTNKLPKYLKDDVVFRFSNIGILRKTL